MDRKRAWRVGPRKVEALRKAAAKFLGTHNFHNFTVGRDFKEKSCHRHMKKIEVRFLGILGSESWMLMLMLITCVYSFRFRTRLCMARRNGLVLCFMGRALCCIRLETSTSFKYTLLTVLLDRMLLRSTILTPFHNLPQRKMMCVLVMLVRTGTPDSLIEAVRYSSFLLISLLTFSLSSIAKGPSPSQKCPP